MQLLTPLAFCKRGTQLEALARGEIERLVGEVDVANESVKQTQDELLAAQVTINGCFLGL